jgi:hypothetical protein
MAHVQGDDDGAGFGVEGTSIRPKGTGLYGYSETGPGVCGLSVGPVSITGIALDPKAVTHGHPPPVGTPMVPPYRTAIYGVTSLGQNTAGVLGQNDAAGGYGMLGISDKGHGVRGLNDTNSGGSGMQPDKGSGVSGDSTNGYGVWGASRNWAGVGGFSETEFGVFGHSTGNNGIHGDSTNGDAVVGFAHANGKAGVLGLSPNGNALAGISDNGNGIFAKGSAFAGVFQGNVDVSGNLSCGGDITLRNADCAEDFDVSEIEEIEPGTVMVINEEGALQQSRQAYDKRVAGVISGAGDFRPGLVLDKQQSEGNRMPIALLGKVYCKVDARYTAIEVGDLLTTSPTPGHAMKAGDPSLAFGAVIGKALRPLQSGQGLVPILIALQ